MFLKKRTERITVGDMRGFKLGLAVVVLILMASSSCCSAGEASALIKFKASSIGLDPKASLSNWSNATSLCAWTGVLCWPGTGQVRGLSLANMGLSGRLVLDDLVALQGLRDVNLRGNHFSGNLSLSAAGGCGFVTADFSSNNFSEPVAAEFWTSCTSLASVNLSKNSIPDAGGLSFGSSLLELDLSHNAISGNGLLGYSLSRCTNVVYLNLSANKLSGRLPPVVSPSCANLTVLDLSYNAISGELPAEFVSKLPASVRQLDLSHNNFIGEFSSFDLGACGGLVALDLSSNGLNGTGLPPTLANCGGHLERLNFSGNYFGGQIPSFWSSFASLKQLSLANNLFSGNIPVELGQTCGTLVELDLSGNELVGGLPATFAGCPALRTLNLGDNQLSGSFIESVIGTMPSLRYLYLPFNNITGGLPFQSLANVTTLEVIDLGSNSFSGEIPTVFGFCSSILALQKLQFPNNFISGSVPAEFGKCTSLRTVDFSFNNLVGPIPAEIWSLPNIVDLIIWANNLTGEIPSNLCSNTPNLESLILGYNSLSGIIPPSLTNCKSLIWVSLSGNKLMGEIPTNMGSLKNLAILQVGNNMLSGQIPSELGSCQNLIWLDLTSNRLSGPIPGELAAQTGLIVPGIVSGKSFAFLRNEGGNICPGAGQLFEFEGIRPERLAKFPRVHTCSWTRIYTGTTVYSFTKNGSMMYMDLSYNFLSGPIPAEFGQMDYLQVLNLGHNDLTGTIPDSFGGMKLIGALDLSHNHLTGTIPGAFGTLSFLNDLDVSNNNLTGPIPSGGQLTTFLPSRYDNNSGLCGLPLPPCGSGARNGTSPDSSYGRKKRIFGSSLVIGVTLSFIIIASLLLAVYKLRKHQKKGGASGNYIESLPTSFGGGGGGTSSWKESGVEPLSINVAAFEKPLRNLTFAHLVEATNDFSAGSLIGSGGFGEVYKAKLEDGSIVAVKKLVRVTGQGDREFTAEMETIGKIKHRNLVPLLGYCKVGEERILVYEYMKHGSLDIVLQTKSKILDWPARKKIAIGSARGLAFLHHSCIPHIIHRDMKSSNVLLDENLEARVSDFGMARLMNALDTHLSVSTLAGTPGYVPPEYYQSFRCTTKGDVYSYGVVLLELLSGKKPIDPLEFGDNNLVGWAKNLLRENRSNDIFDPELLGGKKSGDPELYRYLKIACECLDDRPLRRPTMIQVMAMFKELQIDSDSDFLEGLSMGRSVIDESREKAP